MPYRIAVQIFTVSNSLVAGTFFAFSAFVMAALSACKPEEAAHAMNSINAVIVRSPFIALFVFSGLLSIALPMWAWFGGHRSETGPLLAAGVTYLVGVFVVTVAYNVPLNDRLAVAPDFWPQYVSSWQPWNHVRTVASILSAIILVMAKPGLD